METAAPTLCYIICASPRSGSQLLAQLLTASGLAGHPQEFFNPWNSGHARAGFPHDLLYDADYIHCLLANYTGANGVFGAKAHFLQVSSFVGLNRLESLFPVPLRYISLTRRDDVRQAVSLARAIQTQQWSSDQAVAKEPVYNRLQIQCCLREIQNEKKGWQTFFIERGLQRLEVVYEDFILDFERTLRNILHYLDIGVPEDFQMPAARYQIQSDAITEEWIQRFRTWGPH